VLGTIREESLSFKFRIGNEMKINLVILCSSEKQLYNVMKYFESKEIKPRATTMYPSERIPHAWMDALDKHGGVFLIIMSGYHPTNRDFQEISYNGYNWFGQQYLENNNVQATPYLKFVTEHVLLGVVPPAAPKNNDNRKTCFWCDSPTRKAGGGIYDICTSCGK